MAGARKFTEAKTCEVPGGRHHILATQFNRFCGRTAMPTIETAIEVWITRDADGTLGLDIDESPSGAPIICGFADDMQDYVQINDVITALHGHEINNIDDLVRVLRMPDVAEANKLQLRISRAEKVQQAPAKRRRSLVPSEDTKPGALLQPDAMLVHSLSLPSVLKRLWRPALLVSALIVLILLATLLVRLMIVGISAALTPAPPSPPCWRRRFLLHLCLRRRHCPLRHCLHRRCPLRRHRCPHRRHLHRRCHHRCHLLRRRPHRLRRQCRRPYRLFSRSSQPAQRILAWLSSRLQCSSYSPTAALVLGQAWHGSIYRCWRHAI